MFKKWLLNESVFGSSFRYMVPEDKSQQLYDFYMLAYISNRSQFDHRSSEVGFALKPSGDSSFKHKPDMTNEDKIDYAIKEATDILLPELKKNLLDAVLFSISAEVRHAFDHQDMSKKSLDLAASMGGVFYKSLKEYLKRYTLWASDNSSFFMRPTNFPRHLGVHDSYDASYKAMLQCGLNSVQFVELAKALFSQKNFWPHSYGGKAWANIAQGWLNLNAAKTNAQLFTQIDHIYDLQHNTDTVFNKVKSYMKDGSFIWVNKALEHKAQLKNPYEIIDYVSPSMKKLATRAIYVKFGKTQEDFYKEKDELQNQNTQTKINHNNSNTFWSPTSNDENMDEKAQLDKIGEELVNYEASNFLIKIARFALQNPQIKFSSLEKFISENQNVPLGTFTDELKSCCENENKLLNYIDKLYSENINAHASKLIVEKLNKLGHPNTKFGLGLNENDLFNITNTAQHESIIYLKQITNWPISTCNKVCKILYLYDYGTKVPSIIKDILVLDGGPKQDINLKIARYINFTNSNNLTLDITAILQNLQDDHLSDWDWDAINNFEEKEKELQNIIQKNFNDLVEMVKNKDQAKISTTSLMQHFSEYLSPQLLQMAEKYLIGNDYIEAVKTIRSKLSWPLIFAKQLCDIIRLYLQCHDKMPGILNNPNDIWPKGKFQIPSKVWTNPENPSPVVIPSNHGQPQVKPVQNQIQAQNQVPVQKKGASKSLPKLP